MRSRDQDQGVGAYENLGEYQIKGGQNQGNKKGGRREPREPQDQGEISRIQATAILWKTQEPGEPQDQEEPIGPRDRWGTRRTGGNIKSRGAVGSREQKNSWGTTRTRTEYQSKGGHENHKIQGDQQEHKVIGIMRTRGTTETKRIKGINKPWWTTRNRRTGQSR